jgi:DNA-binding transcriptional LysR family regulator
MNMSQLEVFVKVAETMNITEAAKMLYISQPAVSKALKNLENTLNVRLFIRDKQNGLVLTAVGEELLQLGKQMIALENKMMQVACMENDLLRGTLKVGSFPAATINLLTDVIYTFHQKYPEVTIELVEGTPFQIKEWVENRTVEIGLVTSPFGALESRVLIYDHMTAILPDTHPLHTASTVSLLEHQGDLIFCKGGTEASLMQLLEQHDIHIRESLTVQTADSLIHMVEKNLGIGVISNFTLDSTRHNLLVKDIEPAIQRQHGIVAHSFEQLSPAAREFVRTLTEMNPFND